jgi:hypothetical protein
VHDLLERPALGQFCQTMEKGRDARRGPVRIVRVALLPEPVPGFPIGAPAPDRKPAPVRRRELKQTFY